MINEIEVKEQFYGYLTQEFGDKFTEMIEPPIEAKIGERVLYLLEDSVTASRKKFDRAANDAHRQMLQQMCEEVGAQLSPFSEPPTDSGLPYPRMVDITDWNEVLVKGYVSSGDLLPKKNFTIKWLFGLCFWHSNKQLVYIDFTHPKVKTVLSAEYDDEYDLSMGNNMQSRLEEFKEKRAKLIREVDTNPLAFWAKLVQLNDTVFSQIKTGDSKPHIKN